MSAALSLKVVLLAEDDAGVGELCRDALRREGFDVEACADSQTSLAQILAASPALLIIDSDLPPAGGLTVIGQLRRKGLLVPVILLSSVQDDAVEKACRAWPRVEYLAKPFSIQELLLALTRAASY